MSDRAKKSPTAETYRRLMLQKAVELSQKHGGLRKIPAKVLLENGLEIAGGKSANTVSIALPSEDVMERRIAEMKPARPAVARELEPFKLAPEPAPRALIEEPATMDDFWIEQGWFKIDKNGWRMTRAKWKNDDYTQTKAVRFLVERVLQKDPRDVTKDDFIDNRLGGLLQHLSGSPYKAVSEAFPELEIKEWEMLATPKGFYEKKENRVAAVRWLIERLGRDPRDITKGDFDSNRLGGLLNTHYSASPHQAVSEAFPELEIKEWEMSKTPNSFYKKKENRVAAVRWLVEKLGKDPRDTKGDDFESNRLGGLLATWFSSSPYQAVSEAFPELEIKEWEMPETPNNYYKKKENRVAAVRWMVEKLKKDSIDIKREDFESNRLGGLLAHYFSGSPYQAVSEAFPELEIKEWEMSTTPMGFYIQKKNRVAAVKWLVEKLKKDPRDITQEDFDSNRLGGLFSDYYSCSPHKAISEAFPELAVKEWEMAETPRGFYRQKENRIAAVKWLVEKLGKEARDVTQKDFYSNRLSGLITKYYSSSPYEALFEAGLVTEQDEEYMRGRWKTSKKIGG